MLICIWQSLKAICFGIYWKFMYPEIHFFYVYGGTLKFFFFGTSDRKKNYSRSLGLTEIFVSLVFPYRTFVLKIV